MNPLGWESHGGQACRRVERRGWSAESATVSDESIPRWLVPFEWSSHRANRVCRSAINAAIFLKEFAGTTPWAHFDIAGSAFSEKDLPLAPKGATGVAVRTIPLVLPYNKQDLPRELILSPADLDDALNFRAVPSFSADALHGQGVFETLKAISELVLKKLAAGTAA